jgi:acetyl esterase/lipase
MYSAQFVSFAAAPLSGASIPIDSALAKSTPSAFLACGEDDRPDISEGVPELYLALRKAGVSTELHAFSKTGHGFGLRESNHGPSAGWISLFLQWMEAQGFLKHS